MFAQPKTFEMALSLSFESGKYAWSLGTTEPKIFGKSDKMEGVQVCGGGEIACEI